MIPARQSVHTSTHSSAQLNHKHFHLGGDREFVDNKGVRNVVEASKTKAHIVLITRHRTGPKVHKRPGGISYDGFLFFFETISVNLSWPFGPRPLFIEHKTQVVYNGGARKANERTDNTFQGYRTVHKTLRLYIRAHVLF